MPGRKPKPASLKRATGNPGRRPIAESRVPETGDAAMPAFLEGRPRAVELWNEYAPALRTLGTLKAESAHLFAMWCMLNAEFEARPRSFTAAKISNVRALSSMLGMDPSSQGKFSTPSADADTDPAEAFFAKPRLVG